MPHPFYRGFLAAAALLVLSSGALAADTMPLQRGWSVGPIQAKAQDGRGYCSMKSSYGTGTELVLARDALGANSIAIQLSRKNLRAGKIYPLTLAVGSVERKAEAMAATETVLIAQMGADEIFYDMLARKAVMTAKFEGHDFSFGLQGTSKALMALDNCAAAMNAGQRPKQVKVGLPPVFSDATGGFEPPIDTEVTGGPVVIKVSRPPAERPLVKEDNASSLEIERLRAENKALELENQAAQERLRAAELKKQEINQKQEAAAEARARALAAENEKLKAELLAKEKVEKLARLKAEEPKKNQAMSEGVGVEHPWPAGKTFLSVAEEYIASTGKKCTGDFAHKLGQVRKAGRSETVEAETACIGGRANDEAAALLFVADAGRFIVVTQEGPAEKMSESLQKRAKIAALFE